MANNQSCGCDNNKLFLDCCKPSNVTTTPSHTPTKTSTPAKTPTKSVSATPTPTLSLTPSTTVAPPTQTPTISVTSSCTPTPTITLTKTPSSSRVTPSLTPSISVTRTVTPTPTMTVTRTVTPSKPSYICFNQWHKLTNYDSTFLWTDIISSYDQNKILACADNKQLYISLDSGITWNINEIDRNWTSVACSNNFDILYAANNTSILKSTDNGSSWQTIKTSINCSSISCSNNGSIVLAVASVGSVYISIDYGVTWTNIAQNSPINSLAFWTKTAINNNGSIMYITSNTNIVKSINSGSSWTSIHPISAPWLAIDCSSDGEVIVTAGTNTRIYISRDGGSSWTARESSRSWRDISISSDGTKILATSLDGLYLSIDSGTTWDYINTNINNPYIVNISPDGGKALLGAAGGDIYSASCSYIRATPTPTSTNTPTKSLTPTKTLTATPSPTTPASITNALYWGYIQAPGGSVIRSYPTRIYNDDFSTSTLKFTDIICGNAYTLGISNNYLYGWGDNGYYRLSNTLPYKVLAPSLLDKNNNWTKIDAKYNWSLAMNNQNQLYVWGYGYSGVPNKINNQTWKDFSAGYDHGLAIDNSGYLFSWGRNNYGQLGNGRISSTSSGITQIGTDNNWVAVSAGNHHSLAINSNGELFGWGHNGSKQLAINTSQTTFPNPVKINSNYYWTKIYAGLNTSFAINQQGQLFSWGRNNYGVLGHSISTGIVATITQVGLSDNWRSVSSSSVHTVAINNNNELYSWGSNNGSQLGNGSSSNTANITQYKVTSIDGDQWSKASAGTNHTAAILK